MKIRFPKHSVGSVRLWRREVTLLKWHYSQISVRVCYRDCKCLVSDTAQVTLLSDSCTLCYRYCKCLHQLLTVYKQDYADFRNCDGGVMRSVAPHVRFECNFNLDDNRFSAQFHQYSCTQPQLHLLETSLHNSNCCVCVSRQFKWNMPHGFD
jgi:hypothetical protein